MAGATFVSQNQIGQSANSLTVPVPLPSGAVAGQFYVVVVFGEETTPSATWSASATAITVTGASRANASAVAAQGFLTSTDITNNSITATLTTSKQRTGHILTFDPTTIASSSVVDASIGNNWTGVLTGPAAAVTTTVGDDLIVTAYGNQSAVSFTYSTPTGMTPAGGTALSTTTGMASAAFYLADETTTGSVGPFNSTWTTTNRNGVSVTIAVKSASSTAATATASLSLSASGTATPPGPSGTAALSLTATGTDGATATATAALTLSASGTAGVATDKTSIGYIGDSLTYQGGTGVATIEGQLVPSPGWQGTIIADGVIGRFVYNAGDAGGGTPAVLDGWNSSGFNPYDIVIALGTNDTLSAASSTWAGAITNIRNKIATDLPGIHRIWWVNLLADSTGGQGMNGVIGTHGNSIADYNTFLASTLNGTSEKILDYYTYGSVNLTSSSYWQNDSNHVHMTTAGYTARNAWILSQLDPIAPVQPATASAALTLTAGGTAGVPDTGTAALTLTATGAAKAATTATAALTLTATGAETSADTGTALLSLTATGSTTSPDTGLAALTLTATGSSTSPATAVAALTFAATGSATGPNGASGSAALTFTASGTTRAADTATAALTLAATGAPLAQALATAALTLVASGTDGGRGAGTAALTLTATGAGTGPSMAAGTAFLTLAALATAVTRQGGTALLTLSATGTVEDASGFRDVTLTITLDPPRYSATLDPARFTATLEPA